MEQKLLHRIIVVMILVGLPAWSYAETTRYTFGIVPQQAASKMAKAWTPILKYIGDKSGVKLRFATSRNIPSFKKRIMKGKYDFAYMNPLQYTKVHDAAGYNAFGKAKNKRIKGIIVVQKKNSAKDASELKGQTLAFPSPVAFAASILPRAHLSNIGATITPKYVNSHDSVYRNVAKGRFPGGGGVMRTFKNSPPQIRKKLRVLWTSKGYTPHAFAANSRVPEEVVAKVQQAMLAMDQDPRGKALLKTVRLKGIEAGIDSEWDDVRELSKQLPED